MTGFDNDEDGVLASLAQSVVEFFVPDLERRIEELLRPAVAEAARLDMSVALSGLSVPATIDLAPALDARIEIEQSLDTFELEEPGALVGLAVRARADFEAGDPGADAPGWLAGFASWSATSGWRLHSTERRSRSCAAWWSAPSCRSTPRPSARSSA